MKINKRKICILMGIIGLIAFVAIFAVALLYNSNNKNNELTYNTFIENIEKDNIDNVTISKGPKMEIKLKNDDKKYITDNPRNPSMKEYLLTKNIKVFEDDNTSFVSMFQMIFSMIFLSVSFYVVYKIMNKNNGKSAMALNATALSDDSKSKILFSEVAGNEEAKESVSDIIDFIKNPEEYNKYGARMPRGIIFYGAPGTGKTLMAKAIAGEAGVPFFAVSGSDFVQMYVGVGASRVRELFKSAKEFGKAVIFIDEIDALGKKRSANVAGGNDERDQTLNALLTEMSGFENEEGIIVIAATNRIDIIDEALLRPGRFDRQIEIGLPDLNGRKSILNLHSKEKPLSKNIDINKIAEQTVYFSGAMLENLLNEAAISAVKNKNEVIENSDIEKAYYTIIAGSEKKDKSNLRAIDKKITAFHEAGHALVTKISSPENTVAKITIIPSTKGAGGFCVNIVPDKMYYTKKEIESQIMINYAGRAAEEIIFGKDSITTGASNDIEKSTSIIKDYVVKYGMSENSGLINTNLFENEESNVLSECRIIADNLYKKTKNIILTNIEKLELIANELLLKETLNENELNSIINNKILIDTID